MLKSLKSNSYRFVVVLLLLLTFLTVGVGKVIPCYALAQEITPELEPVYDTEVVSLKDYVDNVLTDAQVAVFNTLLGSYVASQAGLNEYDLEYPYNDRTGVIGWLQNAGLKLYNDIISLGQYDLVTGTDLRTYILRAASYAIGMAQKAHTYTDMNDFLDDVDNSTHYFVPIDPLLQASINSYFGRDYGLWNWQFDTRPFMSNVSWTTTNIPAASTYYTYLGNLPEPHIRANRINNTDPVWYNSYVSNSFFATYTNLFLNTSTGYYYFCSDSGETTSGNLSVAQVSYFNGNGWSATQNRIIYSSRYDQTLPTLVQSVQKIYDSDLNAIGYYHVFLEDFVKHVYVGSDWATKQEIFNIQGLNFQQNTSPSYNQVPDNSYIDLKGFLNDIVNNTNILNVILNNLFKPDGTLNVDPALVKVSITIPDTNPLPVNLNDIQIYTDNEYLDVVKQRALQASETIGEYVAFWHNCDSELVYAILGSFIVILLGAFIGKWGHS